MSPFPSEHSCRLADPKKYDSFARQKRKSSGGKVYSVIFGILRKGGKRKSEEQAYRYPKGTWTASEARSHCKDHGGAFEAAASEFDENELIPDWDEGE